MNVTLSLFAGAGAQFFDNNGNPLSGGKIFTYVAGTTTPLATYTTASDSAFHTNPIILDSAGRVPSGGEIWLNLGQGYKFVVKTANDVLIATYDNIPSSAQPPAANDADSIMYEQGYTVAAGNFVAGKIYRIVSVGTTDFTLIGAVSNTSGLHFIATGVGAGTGTAELSQTVESKLRETVSVKDFGAVGDGVMDDTAAIQAAINAVANQGATLTFLPNETYLFTQIIILSNIVIKATGAVFKASGGLSNSSDVDVVIQDNVHIDEFNLTHPGGSRANSYVIQIGSNTEINTMTVVANVQSNNSCVHLIGNNSTISNFVSKNFDRPLYLQGVSVKTSGTKIFNVDIENFVRGIGINNHGNYLIGEHKIYGRSSNINPLIINPGENGILLEGAPDGFIGNGVVTDAGEHAYRIGGNVTTRTINVKFGSLTAIRPRGCAFKSNPLGKNGGGVQDYAENIFVDEVVGIDVGDGQLGALGKQPDFVRITSTLRFSLGNGICYNEQQAVSCLSGLALNDCGGIFVQSLLVRNSASGIVQLRSNQDVNPGDEGGVNHVYVGQLIGNLDDPTANTAITLDNPLSCGNIYINGIQITGFNVRLAIFSSGFTVGGPINFSGRSFGAVAPNISSPPSSADCTLQWTHNSQTYIGSMVAWRVGVGAAQFMTPSSLDLTGAPNGAFLNSVDITAALDAYTGGYEFSRCGTSRRGAAVAGKQTSSNLAQLGLAFMVKNNTLVGSDLLIEAATLDHNGDFVFSQVSRGPIIKSPDGTNYRLVVNNAGTLSTMAV